MPPRAAARRRDAGRRLGPPGRPASSARRSSGCSSSTASRTPATTRAGALPRLVRAGFADVAVERRLRTVWERSSCCGRALSRARAAAPASRRRQSARPAPRWSAPTVTTASPVPVRGKRRSPHAASAARTAAPGRAGGRGTTVLSTAGPGIRAASTCATNTRPQNAATTSTWMCSGTTRQARAARPPEQPQRPRTPGRRRGPSAAGPAVRRPGYAARGGRRRRRSRWPARWARCRVGRQAAVEPVVDRDEHDRRGEHDLQRDEPGEAALPAAQPAGQGERDDGRRDDRGQPQPRHGGDQQRAPNATAPPACRGCAAPGRRRRPARPRRPGSRGGWSSPP